MMISKKFPGSVILVVFLWVLSAPPVMADSQPDPLPSWKAGPVKASIINFVNTVTDA
jgi:hypothetical protein